MNEQRQYGNVRLPRVALVNPPFGPSLVPNLGLSILSATLRQRGFECRTFYWNLAMTERMPGNDFNEKINLYSQLSGRAWFPYNEWIFTENVYPDGLEDRYEATAREMKRRNGTRQDSPKISPLILELKRQSSFIVNEIADQLEPYDVIGISTTFLQNLPALALARTVKQRWPEKTVVFGGANCDGQMGVGLLRLFPFIDYTFSGEVDFAFPEFLTKLHSADNSAESPGVNMRKADGSPSRGPHMPPIEDLDALPIPDFDNYVEQWERSGYAKHRKLILALESSRGCWWGERKHCTFCGLNANGMNYRRKSEDRFIAEVEQVVRRYKTKYLYMADNILPNQFYGRFMQWAKEADIGMNYFYEIKANVKRQQVAQMAAAGITSVQPGIESFSTPILELMRKGVTGIQNVTMLRLAREYGILSAYSILVGFPKENPEEYKALERQLPKLVHLQPPMGLVEVEFHRFSPYHSKPEDYGLKLVPSWHYQHLYPFPVKDLSEIAYVFENAPPAPPQLHLKPVWEQLRRWIFAYRPNECTLVWRQDGEDIYISDRRPGFGPKDYRLRGFAAVLFTLLDEPRSLRALLAKANACLTEGHAELASHCTTKSITDQPETIISFSARDFLDKYEVLLGELEENALLFSEIAGLSKSGPDLVSLLGGDSGEIDKKAKYYVSLPVHANWRPFEPGWLQ